MSLRAAVYSAGADAVAYGPSAAWWHRLLERPPHQHWITIPKQRRLSRSTQIRLRHRDVHPADVGTVRNLRTTSLPLTEAAVELRAGSAMMDRALQRRTNLRMLEAAHTRNSTRAGAARAGRLLLAAADGGASEAERRFQHLLRERGVTGWTEHFWSCGFEIDVAFVRERIAVEIDGWAWHRDADRFARDAERQNILVNAGWRVLRFTWHHVVFEPEVVIGAVIDALAPSW